MLLKGARWQGLLSGLICCGHFVNAITLDINDPNSIKAAAKIAAANMMRSYTGDQPGQTPGLLPGPYYWWEAGAMFGQLINYWNLTGDTTYNARVFQALQFQVGEENNYMPANQTSDLGNDDQVFWAFTAMDAAESNFQNPPGNRPSWLALAQAVFNTQVARWDTEYCNGGLRWQIYSFNVGYNYKNTISTGGFFQLAARLARFTGNQTYADWAVKSYDWLQAMPVFGKNPDGSFDGNIWDGVYIVNNCTAPTKTYWTYNTGTTLIGAAYMYAYTNGSSLWLDRVNTILRGAGVFFVKSAGLNEPPANAPPNGNIMAEVACEFPAPQTCDYDEPSFKAYLTRWMAVTTQLVPSTLNTTMPRLQASAQAAAAICVGTAAGTQMCGRRWYQTVSDGFYGVGEQMSAMSVFQNLLIGSVAAPLTADKGGTSIGNPAAGTGSSDSSRITDPILNRPITTGDKAGAGALTALALILLIGGVYWMII